MMSQYLVALKRPEATKERNVQPTPAQRVSFRSFVALLLCTLTGLLAIPSTAQAQTSQSTQSQPIAPSNAPERSPSPPTVTYEHGQLTVVAENSTLSQIMSALHNVMGTQVDLPAVSSDERIWAHLGPASAHKVLSDLFANTDLNYIIQGSPTDSGAILSVTLTVRAPDGGPGKSAGSPMEAALIRHGGRIAPEPQPEPTAAPEPTTAEPAPPATAQEAATAQPAPQGAADSASTGASSSSTAASSSPEPASPHEPTAASLAPTGPSNVYPQTPQPSAGSFEAHPSPPPSMSTEQIVQQLSNMYQQRRQMQQGQSPSAPN